VFDKKKGKEKARSNFLDGNRKLPSLSARKGREDVRFINARKLDNTFAAEK